MVIVRESSQKGPQFRRWELETLQGNGLTYPAMLGSLHRLKRTFLGGDMFVSSQEGISNLTMLLTNDEE